MDLDAREKSSDSACPYSLPRLPCSVLTDKNGIIEDLRNEISRLSSTNQAYLKERQELREILRVESLHAGVTTADFDHQPPLVEAAKFSRDRVSMLQSENRELKSAIRSALALIPKSMISDDLMPTYNWIAGLLDDEKGFNE